MDEELIEEFKELFSFDEEKKNSILNKIINNNIIKGDKIDISEDVYKDTNVDKWAYDLPSLQGSKILIDKLIKHPINDRELLEKRQKSIINYDIDIEILKEYEGDILWIYKISEEINENNSIENLTTFCSFTFNSFGFISYV